MIIIITYDKVHLNLIQLTKEMTKKTQKKIARSQDSNEIVLISKTNLSAMYKNNLQALTKEFNQLNAASKQEEITALIDKIETLLQVMDTEAEFKNLTEEFINTNYFKLMFSVRLATLYYYLGNSERAFQIADEAMENIPHFSIIAAYHFLSEFKLINSVDDSYKYQLRLLSIGHEEVVKKYKQPFDAMLQNINKQSFNENLKTFAENTYTFYSNKNDHQKILELFNCLLSYCHSSNEIFNKGIVLCSQYVEQNMEKIDINFIKNYEKLLVTEATCTSLLTYASKENKLDLVIKILEMPFFNQKIAYRLILASALIDNEQEIKKAVQIIKVELQRVNKKGRKPSNIDQNTLAKCYHLIGKLHDFGLYESEYPSSKSLAVQYYMKGADLGWADAMQDLGVMYRDGEGITQDLNKAQEYLTKALVLGNKYAVLPLAEVLYLQSATLFGKESQNKLLEGIKLLKAHPLNDGEWHFKLGFLLVAHDLGLKAVYAKEKIKFGYDVIDVFYYDNDNNQPHLYAKEANYHLELSAESKHIFAYPLLANLYTNGNYFEYNLEKAEHYYQLSHEQNDFFNIDIVYFYFKKMSNEKNIEQKQAIRIKAVEVLAKGINLEAISDVTKEYLTAIQNKLFNEINTFKEKHTTKEWWQSVYKRYNQQFLENVRLAQQLDKALHTINKLLLAADLKNKTLFEELIKMNCILKDSQFEKTRYTKQLKSLMDLEKNLLNIFPDISMLEKIEIVKICSFWPIVKDGTFKAMLNNVTISDEFNLEIILALASALIHSKDSKGLFLEDLTRLCLDQMNSYTFSSVNEVAQMIYICAVTHSNCEQIDATLLAKIEHFIVNNLSFLATHCQEASHHEKSKIYHGLSYLSLVYRQHFEMMDPNLKQFMIENQQNLKNNVLISKQQQKVHNFLKTLDKEYSHEIIAGGRSIDFCKESTKEIILFNGPGHYYDDFTQNKSALVLNPSTILCERTLTLQGMQVTHLSYQEWNAAKSEEEIKSLLQKCLFKNGQQAIPKSTQANLGENPVSFWSNYHYKDKKMEIDNWYGQEKPPL